LAQIRLEHYPHGDTKWIYEIHYPLGKPNDSVAIEIPDHIKDDFREALRCFWVNAYNATAEMCRRAVEASCLNLGAPSNLALEKMIDWLADQQIVTPFMRDVAHKIRLGGNRGAHPNPAPEPPASVPADEAVSLAVADPVLSSGTGPVEKIEKEHAEAIVEFTRQFFHHVYVVRMQLDKYDFSKPKMPKK
jgi:Domain of unknown function (DUF4145)